MAAYYKKRRVSQGPNKNEQKVLRAKKGETQARLAGVLGSKFPAIKHLNIRLTFLDAQQRALEQKTLTLGPEDAAVFTVPCPGRCGMGSFDFGSKITETIGTRLPFSESSAKCPEPLYASSTEMCGCEVKCRMEIDYFPEDAPVADGQTQGVAAP